MNRTRKRSAPVKLTSGDLSSSLELQKDMPILLQCIFLQTKLETGTLLVNLKLKLEDNQSDLFKQFAEGTVTCSSISAESVCSPTAEDCEKCSQKWKTKESVIQLTLKGVDRDCGCGKKKEDCGIKGSSVDDLTGRDGGQGLVKESHGDGDVSENETFELENAEVVISDTADIASSDVGGSAATCRADQQLRSGRGKRESMTKNKLKSRYALKKMKKRSGNQCKGNVDDRERRKGNYEENIKRTTRSSKSNKCEDYLSDKDTNFTAMKNEKRKKSCEICLNESKCECTKQFKCQICYRVFNHASNLRQHRASHTDARPFVCDVCGLGFKTRTNWKTHKSRHAKAFKCDICDRAFSLAPALKYHIRTHTGERPFQCDTCGMTFTSTGGLRAHARRHQVKEKTFKCDLCEKAFISKTNLETHVRIHQGVRPYPCPFCNMRFASRPHLNKHKRQHTKEKAFKCDFCTKAFFTQKLLDIHRGKHTGDKRYSCEVCGNKFTTSSTLKDHMLLHSEVKPFQCHVCKKEFAANKTLKKHMQIHNTENPLVCEFCGKKCPAAKYLKSHMKMHVGYERHHCDVCGKSYRDPGYLRIHMKSHTGEGLIQCEACGEHFADPMYLKLHQKKHCKARKEHCQICGHGFANKNDLGLHMGFHTGERPYGCETCGKAYTSADALADHAKRHDLQMKTHQCSVCFKRYYTVSDLQRHRRRTQCAKGSRFSRTVQLQPVSANLPGSSNLSSELRPPQGGPADMGIEIEQRVAPIIPLTSSEQSSSGFALTSANSIPSHVITSGQLTSEHNTSAVTLAPDLSLTSEKIMTSKQSMTNSSSGLLTIDSSMIGQNVACEVEATSASTSSLDNSLSLALNTVADSSSYIMYNMMPADGKQLEK